MFDRIFAASAGEGPNPRRIVIDASHLKAYCTAASLLSTERQMGDHKGAWLILEVPPSGSMLIADRGYDSTWIREALADKDITPCIPTTKSRNVLIAF